MISLLLALLPLTFPTSYSQYGTSPSFPLNTGDEVTINKDVNNSSVLSYSLDFENAVTFDTQIFSFNFSANVFQFEIDVNRGLTDTNYNFMQVYFRSYSEIYYTNLFLSNVSIEVYTTNNYHTYNLPDVFFLGREYYTSDDDDRFYLEFNESITGYDIDFDVSLMPSSLLDTSQLYHDAYYEGYDNGFDDGYDYAYPRAYQEGYSEGFTEADNMDETALTIFTGILDVGLIPVNFFLGIFNYEVFGINIGALVSALLTVAIVIIIIRIVTGKKGE